MGLCLDNVDVVGSGLNDLLQDTELAAVLGINGKTDEISLIVLVLFQIHALFPGNKDLPVSVEFRVVHGGDSGEFQDHLILEKLHVFNLMVLRLPVIAEHHLIQIKKTAGVIRCRKNLYFTTDAVRRCDHSDFKILFHPVFLSSGFASHALNQSLQADCSSVSPFPLEESAAGLWRASRIA